jgi:hypothetical protein
MTTSQGIDYFIFFKYSGYEPVKRICGYRPLPLWAVKFVLPSGWTPRRLLMRKLYKLLGIIAIGAVIVAASALVLTGCDPDTGST